MGRATLKVHKGKRYINRTYKPKVEKINKKYTKPHCRTTTKRTWEQYRKYAINYNHAYFKRRKQPHKKNRV
jgi:hypothetical protein